jgi:uncharacterized membrane protein YqiK
MLILVPIIAGVVVLVLLILAVPGGMLVNIGGQQVGIVERRYFGKGLPEARVVAMRDEVGVQARVLTPGLHLLPPFIYKARKQEMTAVGEDEVGLVESIDGTPLEPGRIFARCVEGHDSFQDGEAFLRNGGQKGPQVTVLPPGKYRINRISFESGPTPS